tara:strand:- start:291 stop:668 length:378 start_codon:yes stop_codon:yes gene_type:complete
MINIKKQKPLLIALLAFISILSCAKEDPALHMKRGDFWLENGNIDRAILEYKKTTLIYKEDQAQLAREGYEVLGRAHFKLAICYTKNEWWEYALSEAKQSFQYHPNKDSHDLVKLIEQKIALKIN